MTGRNNRRIYVGRYFLGLESRMGADFNKFMNFVY